MKDRRIRSSNVAIAVLAALLLQAAVWELLVFFFHQHRVWYGFFDVTDISIFRAFAEYFAEGYEPYSQIPFEYPPLALPLINLPTNLAQLGSYDWVFAGEMIALCATAAAFTAAASARLWPGLRRSLVTGGVFAAAVLLAGPIVANRYDAAVALAMAVFAYFLARRWWWPAAAALGIGFALKLTPAMFLPLVLLMAARWRASILSVVAFAIAAFTPFLPYLLRAGDGVLYVFTYHARRPLQIESLYASPYLLASVLGSSEVRVSTSYGSQGIAAPGTTLLAALSPSLLAACLAWVYVLLWRRRRHLRDHPEDLSLVLLGMVLVFVCTSKVLSPQFLLWTFPFVALVTAAGGKGRRAVGMVLLAITLLTQLGFPSRYWELVRLAPEPIVLVVARNLLLLGVTVFALVLIRRLPKTHEPPSEETPGRATVGRIDGPV